MNETLHIDATSDDLLYKTLHASFCNGELIDAIDHAMIDQQMSERELIRESLVEWLKKHGYLELESVELEPGDT